MHKSYLNDTYIHLALRDYLHRATTESIKNGRRRSAGGRCAKFPKFTADSRPAHTTHRYEIKFTDTVYIMLTMGFIKYKYGTHD